MESVLLSLAVALVGGLLMSRLAKLINLPAVTAYLVTGLILGPFVIGQLGITGIGFASLGEVEELKIISNVALGFIAFAIGNEFRLSQLKVMGRSAIVVGILQAVITTAIVDLALISIHLINPNLISLSAAITLGAIAAATAPAATLMVVKQYKAEGPLTKLLLMVVAIDDAVGLVLFAASYGIANALQDGNLSFVNVVAEPLIEILASLILGVVSGIILDRLERYFHSRSKRMSLSIAFVLLTVAISMNEFEIGGVHISFSLLLVCMMMGTVFCNICGCSEELMDRVDRWTSPVSILFFVLSGAELDLTILSNSLILMLGVIFIVFRSLGKIFGSFISCKISKCDEKTTKNLGITLLPQAGVALGMALTASNLQGGTTIRNIVLFAVLIYELIGPTLTKMALANAGEITYIKGKSARQPKKREIDAHIEEKKNKKNKK